MKKDKKDQVLEESKKQPLMSKGMIIALIVTVIVVVAAVTTILVVTASKKNEEIQKSAAVSVSKPFDYDKKREYDDEVCYCCYDDECYDCDCYDCDECYCDDCECCTWDDCGYYDECYDNETEGESERASDYSGEELENVLNSDISEITSSSEFSENGLDYSAQNLIDYSLEDAWIEAAEDAGVGQSIYMHLEKSRIITGIKINAGYQRSFEAYNSTSRPRSLLIEFSSGKSTTIELEDAMTTQSFTFDKPIISKGIKITIESVYEGEEFSNTAISEISLF